MRVAIAEDSALFRAGLSTMLRAAGVAVTVEAPDGRQLLDSVREDPPDVAIIDIRMPPTQTDEGLVAAAAIEESHPEVGILILISTYTIPSYAIRLLEIRTRGVGYLLKDRVDDLEQFVDALKRVRRGESVIDHEVVASMVTRHIANAPLRSLSDREREVLQLLAEGRSNDGIVKELTVSPRTVEAHVARIFTKLGLRTETDENRRVLAALTWLRATTEL